MVENKNNQRHTVAVVEDDPNTRARLAEKVNALSDFSVIVSAGSVVEAQELLSQATPDVLLIDLGLPDGSGLDVIRQQSDLHPDMPILVISVFGDEKSVIRAIEAGAQGYLLKSDSSLAIEQCLAQLLAGGAPISAAIARHLIRRLRPEPTEEQRQAQSLLSDRELEVLQLAAKGYSYQDIAELLQVKVSTVGSYTRRMYQKLSVHSRSEAVFEATRMGLMDGPLKRE